MRARTLVLLAAIAVVVVAIVFVIALRSSIAGSTLLGLAGRLLGNSVSATSVRLSTHHLSIAGLRVRSLRNEPVLEAQSLEVEFSLRDMLPGSRRRFGLASVDLTNPHLTVIRRRDGSLNITLPSAGPEGQRQAAPLDLAVRVHGGSATVIDQRRAGPLQTAFSVERFEATAALHPVAASRYDVRCTVVEGRARSAVWGRATLDDARGWEMQHWTAQPIELARIARIALDPATLSVVAGEVRNLDVRYAGIPGPSGAMVRHLDAHADVAGLTFFLAGITKPVRNLRGSLHGYDDGIVSQRLDGTLADVPLRVAGGIIDFAHPKFRLGIVGRGPLRSLASVSVASSRLPLSGQLGFGLLVEGDVAAPLVIARFRAPSVTYARFPFTAPHGTVALYGKRADVVSFATSYAGIAIHGRGTALLERTPSLLFAVHVHAPSRTLPFTGRIIPGVPIDAIAVGSGTGSYGVTGILTGASAQRRIAATFSVDREGVGVAGPLTIEGPHHAALYARVAFDRNHNIAAGFVTLHRFALGTARDGSLPGLQLPALPEIPATVDASLAGIVDGRKPAVWGSLDARGTWGRLKGATGFAADNVAFAGRYTGSLDAVGRIAGAAGLGGTADVPLRILTDGRTTLAQISGARFYGARVGGIALTSLDATIRVRPPRFDIYSARAGVAGGHIVATGFFGNGASIALSTDDLPLDVARAAGLPVHGGRIAAVARVEGSAAAPSVHAVVSVVGARAEGQAIQGSAAIAYDHDDVRVRGGELLVGTSNIGVGGSVSGVSLGKPMMPRYDLNVGVHAVDLGTVAALVHAKLPIEGSADADVHVGGTGSMPQIAGDVAIPEGSINGLFYSGARTRIEGSSAGITAREGHVVVGTSTIAFDGGVTKADQMAHVRAPHADLSDFNDFFDAGDTLAGRGALDVRMQRSGDSVHTSGAVTVTAAQYHRIALGDVAAQWHTTGGAVAGRLNVRGAGGALVTTANVNLPQLRPLDDILHRTSVDVRASVSGLDLGTWLPVVGISAPVVGRIDGDVALRGVPAYATGNAHASLHDGVIAGLEVHSLVVAASARGARATIDSAVLEAPALSASAGGSFGFTPRDALDLHATATTPDLVALARALGRKDFALQGSGEVTASIAGTALRPALSSTIGFTNLRYAGFSVPRVRATVLASGNEAEVRDGEIDLQKGIVRIAARAPVDLRHPALAPDALISAEVNVAGVDASELAPLLPKGSQVRGTLDGTITASGRATAPSFGGMLTFTGGYLATPSLVSPLSNATARVGFTHDGVQLTHAHADVGAGTIDAQGSASTALQDPLNGLAFRATVRSRNAGLNLPKYFNGVIDADLALAKVRGEPISVGGTVTVPKGRIPPGALVVGNSSAPSTAAPIPVAFDMNVIAGRDVRVQGGPVDVGAQGTIHVGGTLAAPQLAGRLRSTGGSIAFYRTFDIQRATLAFAPDDGVIPTIDATATTNVPRPDTDVLLHVTGLATRMNVDLTSSPAYSREQIVGLLLGAQNLGAVSGLAQSGAPGGPGIVQSFAVGTLSQQFTRQLLEPLSAGLGATLGLQNLAINYDPYGGLSARAVKRLGRHLQGEFSENFNYPRRQTVGVTANPSRSTSYQLTIFQQEGSGAFSPFTLAFSSNPALTQAAPPAGTNGFSFVYQRHF